MVSAVLLLTLAAAPVEGESARFKTLFSEGERLFAQAEYPAAVASFREADRVRPTPEVAYDLARCFENLGDAAYATFYYRQYLRRSPRAPDALAVSEQAGEALADAEAEGRGLLEIEAVAPGTATVNGKTYPSFPVAVFLPPGDFDVEARFAGGARRQRVSIHTGRVTSVDLDAPAAPVAADAPAAPRLAASARRASVDLRPDLQLATANLSRTPAWRQPAVVALGASAVALALGTALGALASADEARLRNDRATLTVSGAREVALASSTKGAAADVLWGLGGAAAIAGGLMFVLSTPEPGAHR